jgi:PAS domain S-box-containing protein
MIRELVERLYGFKAQKVTEDTTVIDNLQRLEEVLVEKERRERFVYDILFMLNEDANGNDKIHKIVSRIREFSGFSAVAIRLRQGGDFPYYCFEGFSEDFILEENYLCGNDGQLTCMCGAVLESRTDPSLPYFTPGGAFWTPSTSELLENLDNEVDFPTRRRCAKEGYETVCLIPLRSGDDIVGLLQLNDHRAHALNEEQVRFYEGLGATIGVALRRMLTEKCLKSSEAHYYGILKALPALIFRAKADGTILEADGRRELFYASPEEHIGKRVKDVLPKPVAQAIMATMKECLSGKDEPRTCEYMLPIEGKERWWEARIVRYGEAQNEIFAVVFDITDCRKRRKKGKKSGR